MNSDIGIKSTDILLPSKSVNLEKWAVVACDQYTSEKQYWKDVEAYTAGSPSTLNLIFPECYLEDSDSETRIAAINRTMSEYLEKGIFNTYKDCFILIKRTCGGKSRLGLIAALDLEKYSWDKNSKSLIRATEGTIMSRIPPRKKIRKDAVLELPHILVLISDKDRTVIEKLFSNSGKLKKLYDTQLMKNGGEIEAWLVDSDSDKKGVLSAFEKLYEKLDPDNPLLFAMGDGNHSFATAKSCWEDIKKTLSPEEAENHPARYCLVEIENIYDPGLVFEPIHRVLFNVPEQVFIDELNKVAGQIDYEPFDSYLTLEKKLENRQVQTFAYCTSDKQVIVQLHDTSATIVAGTLQKVLDSLIEKKYSIDYIHGADVTRELGSKPGNIGIFLPAISKDTFFETISKDGALPRKTFSMGEANEKRYYMEARKIKTGIA